MAITNHDRVGKALDLVKEGLRPFIQYEFGYCKVDKLILFGSYVTGANREGSGIDVVVISKDFAGKDYWERTNILSQTIYDVFEPIEAVALTPDEWENGESAIVEYAKTGEIVYG